MRSRSVQLNCVFVITWSAEILIHFIGELLHAHEGGNESEKKRDIERAVLVIRYRLFEVILYNNYHSKLATR